MGRYSHISFAKRPRAYSNLAAVAAISTAVGSLSWCSAFVGLSARGTPSRLTGDTIGRSVAVVDAVVTKEVTEVDDVPTWATGRFPGVKPELIPHEPVKDRQFVDEEAIRELHPFPIPSEDLVELTKAFLNDKFSCDEPGNPRMARNFRFIAPVVPAVGSGLSAEKFCDAFGQFDLMVMFLISIRNSTTSEPIRLSQIASGSRPEAKEPTAGKSSVPCRPLASHSKVLHRPAPALSTSKERLPNSQLVTSWTRKLATLAAWAEFTVFSMQ